MIDGCCIMILIALFGLGCGDWGEHDAVWL